MTTSGADFRMSSRISSSSAAFTMAAEKRESLRRSTADSARAKFLSAMIMEVINFLREAILAIARPTPPAPITSAFITNHPQKFQTLYFQSIYMYGIQQDEDLIGRNWLHIVLLSHDLEATDIGGCNRSTHLFNRWSSIGRHGPHPRTQESRANDCVARKKVHRHQIR